MSVNVPPMSTAIRMDFGEFFEAGIRFHDLRTVIFYSVIDYVVNSTSCTLVALRVLQ